MEQQLDPSMLQPQKLDEAAFTTEVMDMVQQNPQEFKDSLIGGMEEIDPNLIREFKKELASMQLPMEVIEALQKMVDEILSSPNQYELIRQKYLEQGVPEELLPQIFDPTFFGGLQLAISELRKTAAQSANLQEPMTMAQGGLASLGRYGDTMMAHITPSEARLLKRMGGAGTINPQTGLPEFFVFKAVKSVLKGVGKAINKIAKSDIGRIALTVAATYMMGPVGSSLFGANAALATAFNTMAGTTLVGVASGQSLKDSLKEGIYAGISAGFGQAIGSKLSPKFGTAVVRRGIGTGLATTGVNLLRGQDLNKALKGGLGALGQSYGLQVLGNIASGRGAFEGFTRPTQVFKVGGEGPKPIEFDDQGKPIKFDVSEDPSKVVGEYDIESRSEFDNLMPGEDQYDYMQGKSQRLQGERAFEKNEAGFAPEVNYEPLRTKVGETYDKYAKMLSDKINKDSSFKDVDYANRSIGSQFKSQPRGPYDLPETKLSSDYNQQPTLVEKAIGAPFAAARKVYDSIKDFDYGKLNPFEETGFLPSTRRENLFNQNIKDYQTFQDNNPTMNLSFDEYLKASGKKPNMFDIYGPVGTAGLGAYYASGGFSPEQEEQVFDPYYSGLDYIRDNPDRFIGNYATYLPLYAKGGNVNNFPRKNGAIRGPGTGTSDDIPAMLSDGEFVFTAKAVRGLGKGSRRKGAAKMYKLMRELEKRA